MYSSIIFYFQGLREIALPCSRAARRFFAIGAKEAANLHSRMGNLWHQSERKGPWDESQVSLFIFTSSALSD